MWLQLFYVLEPLLVQPWEVVCYFPNLCAGSVFSELVEEISVELRVWEFEVAPDAWAARVFLPAVLLVVEVDSFGEESGAPALISDPLLRQWRGSYEYCSYMLVTQRVASGGLGLGWKLD